MKPRPRGGPNVPGLRPDASRDGRCRGPCHRARSLTRRYADIPALLSDLKEALAIEAARTGRGRTGEVTSVLRSLPLRARRRLPWRMRHRARWLASFALLLVIVALVLIAAAGIRTAAPALLPGSAPSQASCPFHLPRAPPMTTTPSAPDRKTASRWITPWTPTPTPPGAPLTTTKTRSKKAGGTGVGIYLDAAPGVVVRQIELQTPTPGFGVQIYASNNFDASLPYGDSTTLAARGWQGPFGADTSVHSRERIPVDTSGHRFRYYLVWLTTLPPGQELASIAEITLFR